VQLPDPFASTTRSAAIGPSVTVVLCLTPRAAAFDIGTEADQGGRRPCDDGIELTTCRDRDRANIFDGLGEHAESDVGPVPEDRRRFKAIRAGQGVDKVT